MERVLRDLRDAAKRETARDRAARRRAPGDRGNGPPRSEAERPDAADDLAAELAEDQHVALAELARARR